jgi:hypothetical protein
MALIPPSRSYRNPETPTIRSGYTAQETSIQILDAIDDAFLLAATVLTAPAAFDSSIFLSIRARTSSDPVVIISAAMNTNENALLVRKHIASERARSALRHLHEIVAPEWCYRRKSSFARHLAAEKGVTLQRVMNRSFADHSYYTGYFENKRHFTWHGNTVVSKVTRRSMSTEAADTIVYIQLFQ